jgi:chromosome segregation ATPase
MLKDFDSIFGTLLPNTNAKLEPPQGMDETEGLEIKANKSWKKDGLQWHFCGDCCR